MKTSSKIKAVFLIAVAILVMLAVVNFDTIKFTYDMVSIYNQNKNENSTVDLEDNEENKEVIVDNPIEKILKSEKSVDKDELVVEESNNSKTVVEAAPSTETKSSDSYRNTLSTYNTELVDLQNTFISELDGLAAQGIAEYRQGNSASSLALKYLDKGASLESQCDAKFDSLINSMEDELVSNGQDTAIISQIEGYYENLKSQKKEALINKGMEYVNR